MEFSKANLKDLEKLGRLHLSELEEQRCFEAFTKALELAETILPVDTKGVEPMVSPLNLVNVLREDKVLRGLERNKALALATETEDGCYKIPRIL
jgi:aspartyl-tRNA(Asn)/glutamyl-tRNA(Gln) amidotransferase subunit C